MDQATNKPKGILKNVSKFDINTKPDSSDYAYGSRLKYQISKSQQPKKITFNSQNQILQTPLFKNRAEKSQHLIQSQQQQKPLKSNLKLSFKNQPQSSYFQSPPVLKNDVNSANGNTQFDYNFDPFDQDKQTTPTNKFSINGIKTLNNNNNLLEQESTPKQYQSTPYYNPGYAQQNQQHQRINFEVSETPTNKSQQLQKSININQTNSNNTNVQSSSYLPKLNQIKRKSSEGALKIQRQELSKKLNQEKNNQSQSFAEENQKHQYTERSKINSDISNQYQMQSLLAQLQNNQVSNNLLANKKRLSNISDYGNTKPLQFGNRYTQNINQNNSTFSNMSFNKNKIFSFGTDKSPKNYNQKGDNQIQQIQYNNTANQNKNQKFSQSLDNFSLNKSQSNIGVFIINGNLIRYDFDKTIINKKKFEFPYKQFAQIQINGIMGSDGMTPQVLCTGGIDSYKQNGQGGAFLIDWNTKKIDPINSMTSCRFQHTLIYLDDHVYAIGGRNLNGIPQNTVEKLNLNTMNWSQVPSMQYKRTDLTICVNQKNKQIFVTGNPYIIESQLLFEKYDVTLNQWSKIKIKIPELLGLRQFLKEEINLKTIIPNTPGLQTKEQIYFFITSQKTQQSISLLLEYEQDSQHSIVNKLTDIQIYNNCHIFIKSFHLHLVNLDDNKQNAKYGIGNWQKQDIQYKLGFVSK